MSSQPTVTKKNLARKWLEPRTILILAIAVLGMACFLPALYVVEYDGYSSAAGKDWTLIGGVALFFGWSGALAGIWTWYANPFLAASWLFLLRKRFRPSFVAAVAALVLGLTTFTLIQATWACCAFTGPTPLQVVTGIGIGAYVWITSLLLSALAATIGLSVAEGRARARQWAAIGFSAVGVGAIGVLLLTNLQDDIPPEQVYWAHHSQLATRWFIEKVEGAATMTARTATYAANKNAGATSQAATIVGVRRSGTSAAQMRQTEVPQPRATVGRIQIADAFSPGHKWSLDILIGDEKALTTSFREGKYQWRLDSKSHTYVVSAANMATAGDFQLTVVGQQVSGGRECAYGVFHRNYGFLLRGTQEWSLVQNRNRTEFINLLSGSAPAIQPSQKNAIRLVREGSKYIFLVNEQWIGEADVGEIRDGPVGLVLESQGIAGCRIDFDDFEVRVPK